MRTEFVGSRTWFVLAAFLITLASVATTAAASPEPETASAAVLPARSGMDPAQWCRPVVSAAVDPAPLTCWMMLNSGTTDHEDVPHSVSLVGLNFGDLPPFSTIDVLSIAREMDAYVERVALAEAERIAAARLAEADAQRRNRAARAPASTPPSGAGSSGGRPVAAAETCGLKPGDIPTDAQLECMFGPGTQLPIVPIEDDPWDESQYDPSPIFRDPNDFTPVEGPNTLPPAPSFDECPKGWIYDSQTGYSCL